MQDTALWSQRDDLSRASLAATSAASRRLRDPSHSAATTAVPAGAHRPPISTTGGNSSTITANQ